MPGAILPDRSQRRLRWRPWRVSLPTERRSLLTAAIHRFAVNRIPDRTASLTFLNLRDSGSVPVSIFKFVLVFAHPVVEQLQAFVTSNSRLPIQLALSFGC